MSSSGYFARGHSDSRDHGSVWGGAGHPHCPTPGENTHWGSAPNSINATLNIIQEEAKSSCLHPNDLPCLIPLCCPKTPPLLPITCEILDPDSVTSAIPSLPASGTAANSVRILSFHALLPEPRTGSTSNNTQRTENTYFFEDVRLYALKLNCPQ